MNDGLESESDSDEIYDSENDSEDDGAGIGPYAP